MNLLKLDLKVLSEGAKDFEKSLVARVVGQDRAVRTMGHIVQTWSAGFSPPDRPIGSFLFLGPTGSGKTLLVEAMADVLFGNPKSMVKIDCAEFQHDHEISKIIGSPPGYVGYSSACPITNEILESCGNKFYPISLVLFDEIEKAAPAFWQLLLGILDKGMMTLGSGEQVDFTNSIIFLTSNLGSREMQGLMSGGFGFNAAQVSSTSNLDNDFYETATKVAEKHFSPEFMNRIDRVIVFHALKHEHLEKILQIELSKLKKRIVAQSHMGRSMFTFVCSKKAREFLLQEGTDMRYGARKLKRVIERYITVPLSNLIATGQVQMGDQVIIHLEDGELTFYNNVGAMFLRGNDQTTNQ